MFENTILCWSKVELVVVPMASPCRISPKGPTTPYNPVTMCVQADLTSLSSGHARVVDSPVGLFLGGHKRQQTILPTSPASIPASMLFSCTLATKVAKEWQVFDLMCPLLLDISA